MRLVSEEKRRTTRPDYRYKWGAVARPGYTFGLRAGSPGTAPSRRCQGLAPGRNRRVRKDCGTPEEK